MATIVADTQLVIEGTQPHAPYNVSGTATEFQVTLRWQPGYAGGPDYKQDYTIWYREAGFSDWTKVPVTPSGATSVSLQVILMFYNKSPDVFIYLLADSSTSSEHPGTSKNEMLQRSLYDEIEE